MSDNNHYPEPIYSVCIKPVIEDDGMWTGAVDMYLEEVDAEEINPDISDAMRTCVGMMASAFALMEDNSEILEAVGEKFSELYAEHAPLSDEDKALGELQDMDKAFEEADNKPAVSFDGNVIKLNFGKGGKSNG